MLHNRIVAPTVPQMSGRLAPPFGSVAAVRLVDRVTGELSAAILDGRLAQDGALPSEARLAAEFGVSKQVIRESLRQLAALGVVQNGQGRATRVRRLDAEPLGRFWRFAAAGTGEGLAEAVELRRMLEPQAAHLAAQRRTEADLAALHLITTRMRAALGDVMLWVAGDLDFHDQIGRMTHNRLLWLQVRGLRPVIEEVLARFNNRPGQDAATRQATLLRHLRIADAIVTADPDAAQAGMLDHFKAAEVALAELFPRIL